MQEASRLGDLHHGRWEVALVGKAVDDRGSAAIEFMTRNSDECRLFSYDPDTFVASLAGTSENAERTAELLRAERAKRIILEATTLGFVEVFLAARALCQLGVREFSLLYVEPGEYTSPRRTNLLYRREFELSDTVPGYAGIPGATLVSTGRTLQRSIFFLGYEERRLDVALDSQMVRPSETAVVFGVPAFTSGWEMNSFANNIRVIRDGNVSGGIHFCGAENPAAAFEVLLEVYDSLSTGERLVVGPIGTKPNGIGVALFVATHPEVGILYDHPKRSAGRSSGTSGWHLYNAAI